MKQSGYRWCQRAAFRPDRRSRSRLAGLLFLLGLALRDESRAAAAEPIGQLVPLSYERSDLLVDVGVGLWAWPLPMDYNGDGRMDLIVVSTGVPSNGIWYFENTGRPDPATQLPLFKPAVKLGSAKAPKSPRYDPQISYVNGVPVVTTPGQRHPNFKTAGFTQGVPMEAGATITPGPGSVRFRQARLVDYDGDGKTDLIMGVQHGEAGTGRDYDTFGKWLGADLRGYVYLLRNTGTEAEPRYAEPVQLSTTENRAIEVYGMPSPSFADFRGNGKLDLICGEFLDGLTFFENVGTRTAPRYAPGRPLQAEGRALKMDLCMIAPVACDFDQDGDIDLVIAEEDGRVALVENTGKIHEGQPEFRAPRYFRQTSDLLKYGALSAPVSFDLDGDGKEDLVVGDSAGHVGFIKNLGGYPPRWAAPVNVSAGGKVIHEQAGSNGSIQGPSEAKWGYINLGVADWDGDGLPDIVTNGVWGKVVWYRNTGSRTAPAFAAAQPIEVAWTGATPKPAWNWWNPVGKELVTQWRTTPCLIDWNQDGLMDLVMLDPEGYLAWYERRREKSGKLVLLPPQRIFSADGPSVFDAIGQVRNAAPGLLQLNDAGVAQAGRSGRRTFCFYDWDGDGILDLIVNANPSVNWLRGLGRNAQGQWMFHHEGPLSTDVLAGHSTTPTAVDWRGNGVRDLVIGAEDGFFYWLRNPRGSKP